MRLVSPFEDSGLGIVLDGSGKTGSSGDSERWGSLQDVRTRVPTGKWL